MREARNGSERIIKILISGEIILVVRLSSNFTVLNTVCPSDRPQPMTSTIQSILDEAGID